MLLRPLLACALVLALLAAFASAGRHSTADAPFSADVAVTLEQSLVGGDLVYNIKVDGAPW